MQRKLATLLHTLCCDYQDRAWEYKHPWIMPTHGLWLQRATRVTQHCPTLTEAEVDAVATHNQAIETALAKWLPYDWNW